jgi:hypothetical protein
MTERFHVIHHFCWKCSKPLTVQAAWDCPQTWIDKLCKSVVCNRCFEIHDAQQRAWEQRRREANKPQRPKPIRRFQMETYEN